MRGRWMQTMDKWIIVITMVVKSGEVGVEVLCLQHWKVNLNSAETRYSPETFKFSLSSISTSSPSFNTSSASHSPWFPWASFIAARLCKQMQISCYKTENHKKAIHPRKLGEDVCIDQATHFTVLALIFLIQLTTMCCNKLTGKNNPGKF